MNSHEAHEVQDICSEKGRFVCLYTKMIFHQDSPLGCTGSSTLKMFSFDDY